MEQWTENKSMVGFNPSNICKLPKPIKKDKLVG